MKIHPIIVETFHTKCQGGTTRTVKGSTKTFWPNPNSAHVALPLGPTPPFGGNWDPFGGVGDLLVLYVLDAKEHVFRPL